MASSAHTASNRSGHLLRVLGAGFGLAVGVGATIGSGIFRTPGEVAGHLGSGFLIFAIWTLGGLYALLCSSSVSELAAMLPGAGGWYVYARRAFGERAGFVVGCVDWIAESVAVAYLSVALGEFTVELFPVLKHATWVSVAGLLLLTGLNWIGLRSGSRLQEVTSVAKTLAIVALVVGCFVVAPHAAPSALPFRHDHSFSLGLLLALPSVIITYDGWYTPIYFAEEDTDPARNLPRAMIGTVLACMAVYLMINAAVLHVLGIHQLAGSHVPVAEAALSVFGGYGRRIILIISLVSVLSATNAVLMLSPRILFAMARDRFLPRRVAQVNPGGTPTTALFLGAALSLALVLSGTFETLIAMASILFVAVYLSSFAALLVLRRREPDLPRPYKVWFYPWSTWLVLLVSAAFLVGSFLGDLRHSLFTVLLILVSYIAAVFITRRRA